MSTAEINTHKKVNTHRLLFMDFSRGIAIIGVIIIHALIYYSFNGVDDALATIPAAVQPFLLPIILFASWAAIFAMISGAANAYTIRAQIARGKPLGKTIIGVFINALFVLFYHFIYVILFTHFRDIDGTIVRSFIAGSIETGTLYTPDFALMFFADALLLISLSMMISALILYFLWRKEGYKKRRRNFKILAIIAVTWLLISPLMHTIFEPVYHWAFETSNYPLALIMSFSVGTRHCLFPFSGFAVIGVIFGILISEDVKHENYKTIKRVGYGGGLLVLVIDIIFIIITGFPDISGGVLPPGIYLLNLSLMMIFLTALIGYFEYRPQARRKHLADKTTGIRRFGLVSLTVYTLESPLAALFSRIIKTIAPGALPGNVWVILAYIGFMVTLWTIIVKLWEKINFKYSFEWLLIAFV